MPIFTLNFFLVFFWGALIYIFPLNQRKKDLFFLSIIFLQFTFLAWQRDYSVGQDTIAYYQGFQRFSDKSLFALFPSEWEPGYVLYNWVVAQLGFDYHYYLLFTAVFIYYSFLRFVYKYSKNVWLSVVVFIAFSWYFVSLHVLRQFMAISIILYSYKYLLNRNLIKFILLVLLASSFHTSAILFLATYPLCNREIHAGIFGLVFTASFFLALIFGKILMIFLMFSDKYAAVYLNNDSAGTGYSMLLVLTIIMVIGLILKPKILTRKSKLFYWSFFIALCLQTLATQVSIVSRGILYWLLSASVFIPMIIGYIENKKLRLLSYCLVTLGLVIFFLLFTNSAEGIESWGTYRWYNS